MSNKLSWRDALKQFNDDRIKEGGKYSIPKRGTPEYASIRKLMGDDMEAVELKPNQTITGQDPPPAPVKQTRAKSRTPPKQKPDDVSTKEKPQWVDEPKPVEKKAKKEKPVAPEVADVVAEAPIQKKSKNKKKNVATQTEAPSSPKSEDFIVKLK